MQRVRGVLLLGALTDILSGSRKVSPWREIANHLVVVVIVVAASRMLGGWIAVHISS